MKFEELGIIKPITRAISEKGYQTPTQIQKETIPLILERKDILGCAQTGTGKTAAFAIPIIQLIEQIDVKQSNKPTLRALIVTPTRELAIQIGDNITAYAKHTKVSHSVIYGGVKPGKQIDAMKRGVHILIATPGRLLDLENQGYIKLNSIKMFVLDEADRMLDMGFIHDIKKIISKLPEKRQSLFFSATMPEDITALSRKILLNPQKIEAQRASSSAVTVQQQVYYTNRTSKIDVLEHLINKYEGEQILIFSRTKHGSDRIARNLKKRGIFANVIHGDKAQNQRQKALTNFKTKKVLLLIATDIAARGIDVAQLGVVINYDVPNLAETYVHRIGRSGRAGEKGLAISICEPEENIYIRKIENLIDKKIEVLDNQDFPQTDKPMTAEEKKAWNQEKIKRKKEYFENRKKGNGQKLRSKGRPSSDSDKDSKKESNRGSRKSSNRFSKQDEGSRKPTNRNTKQEEGTNKSSNQQSKGKDGSKRPSNSKSKPYKSRRGPRKTGMSDNLKGKFMWPIEK